MFFMALISSVTFFFIYLCYKKYMEIIKNFETEHYNERQPHGIRPRFLILHGTQVDKKESLQILTGRSDREVSSHYMISEDGTIHYLVEEQYRAWHAGQAYWADETDINSLSIGIELVAFSPSGTFEEVVYPGSQINSLIILAKDVCTQYSIEPWHVLGHEDVSPGRKRDPGIRFPWRKLADNGVGIWPAVDASNKHEKLLDKDEIQHFYACLWGYGYNVNMFDEAKKKEALEAFRRHYVPDLANRPNPLAPCWYDLAVIQYLAEAKSNKFF